MAFADVMAIDITIIKMMIGLDSSDTDQDNVLKILKNHIMNNIAILVGKKISEFPTDLEYIADEILSARYNQLNSEGIKMEATDITRYDYREDIYANYYGILDQYVVNEADDNGIRKLRML